MNPAQKVISLLDQMQQRWPGLAFPVAVWKKFGDDQAGNLAALIAYYGFVSIFPLLLLLVTVLDILLRHQPGLQQKLINSALADYPVFGEQLKNSVHSLNQTGLALVIGIALTLFGARSVANAMQNAMNTVWAVPKADRPGFPWSWLRSIALVLVVGIGEIITSAAGGMIGGAGGVLPGFADKTAVTAGSLLLNMCVFWLAFRLAAARAVTWRELRLGAIIAGCAWQALQLVSGYFITHQLAHSTSLYGTTFGVVLGLIAWLYLQAQTTLYAVEANVVHTRKLWPRSLAPPRTAEDARAYQLYAEAEQRDKAASIDVQLHDGPQPDEPAVSAGQTRGGDPNDSDEQRRPAGR